MIQNLYQENHSIENSADKRRETISDKDTIRRFVNAFTMTGNRIMGANIPCEKKKWQVRAIQLDLQAKGAINWDNELRVRREFADELIELGNDKDFMSKLGLLSRIYKSIEVVPKLRPEHEEALVKAFSLKNVDSVISVLIEANNNLVDGKFKADNPGLRERVNNFLGQIEENKDKSSTMEISFNDLSEHKLKIIYNGQNGQISSDVSRGGLFTKYSV